MLCRDREPRWARPLPNAWVSFPWRYQDRLMAILLIRKLTHVLSWGLSQRGFRLVSPSFFFGGSLLLLLLRLLLMLLLLPLLLPLELLLDTFKSCSSISSFLLSKGNGGGGNSGGGAGGGENPFQKTRPLGVVFDAWRDLKTKENHFH